MPLSMKGPTERKVLENTEDGDCKGLSCELPGHSLVAELAFSRHWHIQNIVIWQVLIEIMIVAYQAADHVEAG